MISNNIAQLNYKDISRYDTFTYRYRNLLYDVIKQIFINYMKTPGILTLSFRIKELYVEISENIMKY